MPTFVRLTLASLILTLACGDDGNMPTTQATSNGPTSDPSGDPTTAPTTGEPATDASGDPSTDPTEAGEDLMTNYGAPCMEDSDCFSVLSPDAKCLKDILMVYALPGGYCSNFCSLPDSQTTFVKNAPDCLMGADCVGLDMYFEGCAFECQDSSQCPRDGYECRRMPTISKDGDPKYCLMTEDNMIMP